MFYKTQCQSLNAKYMMSSHAQKQIPQLRFIKYNQTSVQVHKDRRGHVPFKHSNVGKIPQHLQS